MASYHTILITGASSGFGKATAELLLAHGYKLILLARRAERLQELQHKTPERVHIGQVDIRQREEVANCFAKLPAQFQDIDIIINNAGLASGLDSALNAKLEDWETMVDTNIKGLLYVTRFGLDIMKKHNKGLIINIGSVSATIPYPGSHVYGASKAFVKQFSRNLRADLIGTDIKVTNIEPGMAETEFSIVRFKGDIERAQQVYANARALTAQDIANTIKWIIDQPINVNIDNIEIMPIDQTFGGMVVNRKSS